MPNYRARAAAYARKHGIPVDVFLRQIQQESNFNPKARSYADARGIAQIVPRWHPDVNPNMPGNQLPGMNPEWDLDYGARLMANHMKRYGSIERALSAYNSGRPDAYKDPSFAKGQTYNYVKKIMGGKTPEVGLGGSVMPSPATTGGYPTPGMGNSLQTLTTAWLAQRREARYSGKKSPGILGLALARDQLTASEQMFGKVEPAPVRGESPVEKAAAGMNPDFQRRLNAMIQASGGRLSISSGYRSVQEQAALWANALRKYGSPEVARNWVAPPGRSNHNHGIAADLRGDLAWARRNAARFGLYFPMSHEPWHIEPAGSRR